MTCTGLDVNFYSQCEEFMRVGGGSIEREEGKGNVSFPAEQIRSVSLLTNTIP